jgi:hypothetical protein
MPSIPPTGGQWTVDVAGAAAGAAVDAAAAAAAAAAEEEEDAAGADVGWQVRRRVRLQAAILHS